MAWTLYKELIYEADAVPADGSQSPSRRGDRGLAATRRIKPSALDAGDVALEICHGSDQRRSGLAGRSVMGAIEAVREEAQRSEVANTCDSAVPEVGLGDGAGDRPCHRDRCLPG